MIRFCVFFILNNWFWGLRTFSLLLTLISGFAEALVLKIDAKL